MKALYKREFGVDVFIVRKPYDELLELAKQLRRDNPGTLYFIK